MLPDEDMEEDYVDFVVNQALSDDEKEFLNTELESNNALSMIFDKVIEVAAEFSGEGPVDGPGTEISDSIPARLSDGEFVFTAEAVKVIGVENPSTPEEIQLNEDLPKANKIIAIAEELGLDVNNLASVGEETLKKIAEQPDVPLPDVINETTCCIDDPLGIR
jgi:hypothetical protein